MVTSYKVKATFLIDRLLFILQPNKLYEIITSVDKKSTINHILTIMITAVIISEKQVQ